MVAAVPNVSPRLKTGFGGESKPREEHVWNLSLHKIFSKVGFDTFFVGGRDLLCANWKHGGVSIIQRRG